MRRSMTGGSLFSRRRWLGLWLLALLVVAALIGLLAALMQSGCGPDEETASAPVPTIAPTASPSPKGTVVPTALPAATAIPSASPTAEGDWTGPLFVYEREIERPDETGHGGYLFEVVVYDIGAKREFAAFQPGQPNEHLQFAIAGDKLIVQGRSRIVRYDADGSNPVVLREASSSGEIIEMGVSQDGRRLAVTEARPEGPTPTPSTAGGGEMRRQVTYVVVIDVATGKEILAIPQSVPGFRGFVGQAGKVTWRDDGQGMVVQGYLYSESPGGTATVMLDGSVRTEALQGYVKVAPNGRYAEHGVISPKPLGGMSALQDGIALYDLTGERELASVSGDDLLFMPWEWAPDGTEFLYSTYSPRPSSDWPGYLEQDPASERWYLLRVDGSPPEPVAGLEAVREHWYGERNVQFRCSGEVSRMPFCSDSTGREQPVDIYVGGTLVGGGYDVNVVGFVDR